MTNDDIAAGVAALTTYARAAEGWKAAFVPAAAYRDSTTAIIRAADASKDQSAAGRQAAAQDALRTAIDSSGYGGEVTDAMCVAGARAVLAAVAVERAKQPKPKEQT